LWGRPLACPTTSPAEFRPCPLAAPLVAVAYPISPQLYDDSRDGPIDAALRVVKRRNAEPVPFELKYLPVHDSTWNGPRGVVAIRPCGF
jgi:hypothetical protein